MIKFFHYKEKEVRVFGNRRDGKGHLLLTAVNSREPEKKKLTFGSLVGFVV